VRGTARLLHALQSFEVEQFVFASTMLVHAPTKPGKPIDENAPLDPRLPYPESKMRTERLIHEQRGRFCTAGGVYDDGCHEAFSRTTSRGSTSGG
jgi:nucleoside-diphosphate-sugar epimerase